MSESTPRDRNNDEHVRLSESASDQFTAFQYETNNAVDASGTPTREDDFDA